MDLSKTLWLLLYGLLVLGLCGYGAHRLHLLWLFWNHRNDDPKPRDRFDQLPSVLVQLPIYNERHVVLRLLASVAALDYPKERLEIQILDDSTDETRELCEAGADELRAAGLRVQCLHREHREGFKAGALAEGLVRNSSDFVLILDADFAPQPDLIRQLVHHFTDAEIGMVQARWGHTNRGHNLLTRLQAILLDGHLVIEQTARFRSGRFFNFNGTAGMWRRQAIDDAGGWSADTLTEDLDLSYRAQLAGWKFIFRDDVEVPAELPTDMNGFKSQQHRWAKGSIETARKLLPALWKSEVPLATKLEATAHLTANVSYLLLIGLCILSYPALLAAAPFDGWRRLAFIDLPVFFLATISVLLFYAVSQAAQRGRWKRRLLLLPLVLALGVGMAINNGRAVIEALVGARSAFVRTPKFGGNGGQRRSVYRSPLSPTLLIELLVLGYFGGMIILGTLSGNVALLPFLLLIGGGLLYVVACSIGPVLRRWVGKRSNTTES